MSCEGRVNKPYRAGRLIGRPPCWAAALAPGGLGICELSDRKRQILASGAIRCNLTTDAAVVYRDAGQRTEKGKAAQLAWLEE